jgi:two-component system, cell cycle sensor histidine kinase and response regulator CckA
MMMPDMDGETAIQTLKQINPFIKIIATSGLPPSDRASSVKEVEAFLSKPYTAQELLKTLHTVNAK